nr:immunoglobulin light chain junction region [Macaca mulatta]MOX17414.1 immunoglobulin light chain junction region [Macaca mulatta]MOX17483.1 immunoglobulin light chain junction region [Macaca mulatta]MOX17978.1 immunoglobulin light chain junction region [Macaca mulatta]MOX18115.1 immunoglobulin light chain junction region [Macaca mulatta]
DYYCQTWTGDIGLF